jgi:undecaprenyl-diphosphatase
MSYFDAVLLGILQGLTEFLPVSSSGHLVLAQELLHVSDPGVSFEVVLHLGTLLSVVVYFRRRLLDLLISLGRKSMTDEHQLIGLLVIGTIPAAIIGLALADFFERAFSNPLLTSIMLLATGLILWLSRFVKYGTARLKWLSALIMGLGQALAILPGISRSGSTIVAGMAAGVKPSTAAEFSFLLAIPAISGAALLSAKDLLALEGAMVGQYLLGGLTAFVMGLAAVYAVMTVVSRGRFEYFAYYCFAAGLLGLYLFW